MTLQDDLARHWFQPMVPMEAHKERARPGSAGPLNTRIEGELSLDEAKAPPRPEPAPAPEPDRVEVTQPYIPAIREQPPEFAKRPNPSTAAPEPLGAPPPSVVHPAPTDRISAPRTEPKPDDAPTGRITRPAPEPQQAEPPRKRRSLARRVVRKIIGPDLLRKDPAPKRR